MSRSSQASTVARDVPGHSSRLAGVGEYPVPSHGATGETEPAIHTVSEVMLRHPKTLPAGASIAQARAAFKDDHVHMILLTERGTLVGTLVRADLPAATTDGPALPWARLAGRTVSPGAPTRTVQDHLVDREIRRVAVVDADGLLLGLMCLKRDRTGFCSDADVASRSRDRDDSSQRIVHDDERAN
jgi:CBS domain-containing protein